MTRDEAMIVKHEKYSLDLLNYEIAQYLGDPNRLSELPRNRFSGRRVRQGLKAANSKRMHGHMTQIEKRERRLRKYGMSLIMFAS